MLNTFYLSAFLCQHILPLLKSSQRNSVHFGIMQIEIITVMNVQEKEIFRLTKQLQIKEEEFKRERTLLQQKIELLSSEVAEYQEKQFKNKQLNESIILTYRQNESFRDQLNQRELQNIMQQHHNQITTLKQKHQEEKKRYEEQLQQLRSQKEKLRLEAEKNQLDYEKAIAEVRREFEEKDHQQQNDLNVLFSHQIGLLSDKLRQAEEMAQIYKDQLQSRVRQSYRSQCESGENYPKECVLKARKEQQMDSRSGDSNLSVLQMRINRALVQLNPKQAELEQRIRQIKFKIY